MSEKIKKWRNTTKERIIESFGGGCGICGYNKCFAALELHHIDPTQKEFGLGDIRASPKSWDKIVQELKKCVLLCANCHREYHAGFIKIPINILRFDKKYEDYKLLNDNYHSCICGVLITKRKKHCSIKCANRSRQKIDWQAEKDNLFNLRINKKMSYADIGKIYNVGENAVAKWCKRLLYLK